MFTDYALYFWVKVIKKITREAMLRAYLINIKIIEILNIKISSYFFSLHRMKRKPFIAKYIHNKRLEKKNSNILKKNRTRFILIG